MNAKECKLLMKFLDSTNDTILASAVKDDLNQQLLADTLKHLADALCSNEELLSTLVSCHRKCFADLYVDCKKMPDPMLDFQICWYKQCSTFLLSEEHDLAVLNFKKRPECGISNTRDSWLCSCSTNGAPAIH